MLSRFGGVALHDAPASNGDKRWLLIAYDTAGNEIGRTRCEGEREAMQAMSSARAQTPEWVNTGAPRAATAAEPDADHPRDFDGIPFDLDEQGNPLPRHPNSESYMRGWNQTKGSVERRTSKRRAQDAGTRNDDNQANARTQMGKRRENNDAAASR